MEQHTIRRDKTWQKKVQADTKDQNCTVEMRKQEAGK